LTLDFSTKSSDACSSSSDISLLSVSAGVTSSMPQM
jgi:hypothetical protein